jgi:hypothetical protein
MNRLLPLAFALILTGTLLAETPEERAKKVTVTMNLTDVPPDAVARFIEVLSKVKVNYVGHPGDRTLLSVEFENSTADAALRYLAELAKLDLTYKPDGAYFSPKK